MHETQKPSVSQGLYPILLLALLALTTSAYTSLGISQDSNPQPQLLKASVYHSATSADALSLAGSIRVPKCTPCVPSLRITPNLDLLGLKNKAIKRTSGKIFHCQICKPLPRSTASEPSDQMPPKHISAKVALATSGLQWTYQSTGQTTWHP